MKNINYSFLIFILLVLIAAKLLIKNEYYLSIVIFGMFNAINASCFNILLGYTGIISLGQAAFYGIGAYFAVIVAASYGINPVLAILLASVFSAIAAFVVGYPTLKLHGHYLAMATLGFGMIIYVLMNEMDFITGGPSGFLDISKFSLLGISIYGEHSFYTFVAIMFFIFTVLFEMFDKSYLSYKLKFIKESEFASKSFGINIFKTKLLVFSVTAGITAFNGGIYAYYSGFISPVSFNFNYSIELLTMAIVGGLGTVPGGIIGAAVLTALPEFMASIEDYEMILYGCFLAVTIIFLPGGLTGLINRILNKNAAN